MAKFLIQCPHCGTYNHASTSIFSSRVIECSCGKVIDIKKSRMISKVCPHCKNTVVYDQAKGKNAICPVCKEKLVTDESIRNTADIICPSCSCELTVDKSAHTYECPLCETKINVQEQIKKQALKKEGLVSVIKYEGPNDVLVWKHPIEDFNLGSQLIVHESQEALFFKDGKALDLYGAGRFTLTTDSIPLLESLYELPDGSSEVFHSEIYFINLITQTSIKWGTDSKVRMFDPISGLHLEIGACGNFNIKVSNSRKLLLKLIGTEKKLSQNEIMGTDYSTTAMAGKFKALVMNKVKTYLAKAIRENDINILEIDEHIEELSEIIKEKINVVLEEYGLTMPEFFITSVLTPDDDPNFKRMKEQHAERYLRVQQERILQAEAEAAQARKIVQAQTAAQEEVIAAQAQAQAYRLKAEAEAEEMHLKGYTYQEETARQVATEAVKNGGLGSGEGSGVGSTIGGMVNLGVGLGVMTEVVKTVKETITPAVSAGTEAGTSAVDTSWECPNCHSRNTSPFCPNCGLPKPVVSEGWDCSCGVKHIKTNFCPNCGKRRE